jgi:hypothetical protein
MVLVSTVKGAGADELEHAFPTVINDTTSVAQDRGGTWTTDCAGGRYGYARSAS